MKNLKSVTDQIEIWDDWKKSYNNFVPKFIQEATSKESWKDWNPEVFKEFFEKSNDQCVSSLQQGYFTNAEKEKIKNDWSTIGPPLRQIASIQNELQLDIYKELAKQIRKHTTQNRVASTNRIIASLQPHLFCTIVNEKKLDWLIYFLQTNIENCPVEKKGNWYQKSNAVLNYFVSELRRPATEIMTLPWQVYEHFKNGNTNNSNDMSETGIELEELNKLLRYKKQIILQGPPGTGKTRMAKRMAENLVIPNHVSVLEVTKILKSGMIFKGDYLNDIFKITKVSEDAVEYIRLYDSKKFDDWTKTISSAYSKLVTLKKEGRSEGLSYSEYLARHILEMHKNSEQLQIVQFHPSYTYEDFVRGITVRTSSDDVGVAYETENRVFGTIIEDANKNLIDSQKDTETLSYENWVETIFDSFIKYLKGLLIEPESSISLTEKVSIVSLEEDALRYKGRKGWSKKGNRMLFDDIITAIVDNNQSRQDIKKNTNLSGLAKWHASYYIRVVDLFYTFIEDQHLEYNSTEESLVPRKEYVLIIDEINRANLSSVLGELIYALEYRNEGVSSIYSIGDKDELLIPDNLHIIGTMNTADRSVAQIDYAIRRRFAFVDVLPKNLATELQTNFKEDLFNKVAEIFINDFDPETDYSGDSEMKNSEYLSEEFSPKDVWLGHSYFIQQYEKDENDKNNLDKPYDFELRLNYEIKPILREYVKDGILKKTALTAIEELSCSE